MADELPSGDKVVPTFLGWIAVAFVFGGVEALLGGKSLICVLALACAVLFLLAGIQFPWIKSKFVSVDWNLWIKRIDRVLRVVLVLSIIMVVATGYYTCRKASLALSQISREFSIFLGHIQTATKEQVPKSQNAPAVPSQVPKSRKSPEAPSTRRVDWHDKQNWRRFLHSGMTRTEVRRLFGEAEKMAVVSTTEFWDYGSGEVQFDMENHPDGSLDAWFEPGI